MSKRLTILSTIAIFFALNTILPTAYGQNADTSRIFFIGFELQQSIDSAPGVKFITPDDFTDPVNHIESRPEFDYLFIAVYDSTGALDSLYPAVNSCHGNYLYTQQVHFLGQDTVLGDPYITAMPIKPGFALVYNNIVIDFVSIGKQITATDGPANTMTSRQIAPWDSSYEQADRGVEREYKDSVYEWKSTPLIQRCSTVIPLPVDLSYFNARYDEMERVVRVDWTTQSETNNMKFEVFRSFDGMNKELISVVPGAGYSQAEISYHIVDMNPAPGNNYYQLKQTDFNGQSETFNWIRVFVPTEVSLKYENPIVGNEIPLYTFSENSVEVNLSVADITGKIIWHSSREINGRGLIQIPAWDLDNGIYFLFVRDHLGHILNREKIVINR